MKLFFFPKTSFTIITNKSEKEINQIFHNLSNGQLKPEIDTIFGLKSVEYNVEIYKNEIQLTRAVGFASRLPIYPTAKLLIIKEDGINKILISISLSILWKLFFCLLLILITIVTLMNLIYDTKMNNDILILSKFFGSFSIILFVIHFYHFYENKNLKYILGNLLDNKND
jgi:phosphoglycerol transferase MdoB-like AlkP superfamily enzyme